MNNISILYFGRLREQFGCNQETLDQNNLTCVRDLLVFLQTRGDVWIKELAADQNFRVAVNQKIAQPDTKIESGAEIAIFPPVTGG